MRDRCRGSSSSRRPLVLLLFGTMSSFTFASLSLSASFCGAHMLTMHPLFATPQAANIQPTVKQPANFQQSFGRPTSQKKRQNQVHPSQTRVTTGCCCLWLRQAEHFAASCKPTILKFQCPTFSGRLGGCLLACQSLPEPDVCP